MIGEALHAKQRRKGVPLTFRPASIREMADGLAYPPACQFSVRAALPACDKLGTARQAALHWGRIRKPGGPVAEIECHYCLLLLKRLAQAREVVAISDRRDEHR